jgi:hypothetical protein
MPPRAGPFLLMRMRRQPCLWSERRRRPGTGGRRDRPAADQTTSDSALAILDRRPIISAIIELTTSRHFELRDENIELESLSDFDPRARVAVAPRKRTFFDSVLLPRLCRAFPWPTTTSAVPKLTLTGTIGRYRAVGSGAKSPASRDAATRSEAIPSRKRRPLLRRSRC